MPDNPMMKDLWREMEAAADTSAEKAITIPRQPFQRRISLIEKLIAATLNGYVPAFLAVAAGSLAATSQRAVLMPSTAVFGVGLYVALMLVTLPLILIMRGLWAAPKANPVRYLSLVVLTMGLSYQASALTLAGFASQYLNPLNRREFVTLIQDLTQTFLTPLPIAAAALLGLVLVNVIKRLRRGSPWIEMRPAATGMLLVGWLILLCPWLALTACALTSGHIAPEAQAEYLRFSTDQSLTRIRLDPEQRQLRQELSNQEAYYLSSESIRSWTPATVRKTETKVLALLERASNPDTLYGEEYEIGTALLKRSESLREPAELGWRLLERASKDGMSRIRTGDLVTVFREVLFPRFCDTPLSKAELGQELARIKKLEKALPSAPDELEATFLKFCEGSFGSTNGKNGARPLTAFGLELPFSPERSLAEYRTRLVIYPWREIRAGLDFSSPNALQRSMNQAMVGRSSFFAYRSKDDVLVKSATVAAERHTGLLFRAHLRAAQILLSLRLYKAEHETYPQSLKQLQLTPALESGECAYDSDGQQANLKFPLSRYLYEVGPETTWTLH